MGKVLKRKNKAASKVVKPEDDDGAGQNSLVDLPPKEIVFSIDHILHQIFRLLDTHSLFTCRLVSHLFLNSARRPLEERICKRFHYKEPQSTTAVDASGREFTQLMKFLEKPVIASKYCSRFSFPCTNFCIYGPQLGNRVLQTFFNIYGQRIEKLEIFPYKRDNVHENIRIKQLRRLLTAQAPHLERLYLAVFPKVNWCQRIPPEGYTNTNINENQGNRSRNSILLKTDPEFQQISARVDSSPKRSRSRSSLKSLIISGCGLAKTIEFLIHLSPELQEVVVRQGATRPCDNKLTILSYGDCRHLQEPVNRIHLIKSLSFQPTLKTDEKHYGSNYICFDMGTMEKISLDNNLRLRELEINFWRALPLCKIDREFENQVVVILNRILEGSKDSLERLCLRSFTFLRGLKMPKIMPNVREIEIGYFGYIRVQNSTLFPKGFSMTETFPRLTCFNIVGAEFWSWNDFYCVENYLNFGGDEDGPALCFGVKRVNVIPDFDHVRPGNLTRIPSLLNHGIQKFFPSAEIEIAQKPAGVLFNG